MNDETFGPDAAIGDWEEDHEKLAEITESNRPHNQTATNKKVCCPRCCFNFYKVLKPMKTYNLAFNIRLVLISQ